MIILKHKYSWFNHPNKVCMSYANHFVFATWLSLRLFEASLQSIIHAFFPFLFETSTSDTILYITKVIKENGCTNN